MRAGPEQREEREGLIHILQSVSPSAMQCEIWINQIPRLFRVIMSFVFKETVS